MITVSGIFGLLLLLLATNANDRQQFPRHLEVASETEFDDFQMVAPLFVIMTAGVVNCCAGAGAVMFGVEDPAEVMGYALKMLFVDGVDQLVSIYLVIWCHMTSVGYGVLALAWSACIFGLPPFFATTFAMQAEMRGASTPMKVVNFCGLIADLFSIAAMAVIELATQEEDLLPGWLKVLDYVWSIASIIAEVCVLMSPGKGQSVLSVAQSALAVVIGKSSV